MDICIKKSVILFHLAQGPGEKLLQRWVDFPPPPCFFVYSVLSVRWRFVRKIDTLMDFYGHKQGGIELHLSTKIHLDSLYME